jgi:circadian clock protein KaiB
MSGSATADQWALTLYVDGASASSIQAVETVRRVCDEELRGRADLVVIDVRTQPELVARDQIVAVPTLVRRLPGPVRRVVGGLSDPARLRLGLGLGVVEDSAEHPELDG